MSRVKRLLALVLSLAVVLTATLAGGAATFDQLSDPALYLKQASGSKTCTLVSAAMLLRRAALMQGKDYAPLTEEALRPVAWAEGAGLRFAFTWEGLRVDHGYVGSESAAEVMRRLLDAHPEGIVAYNANQPHAVLLCDYDADGVFYCADPASGTPAGRIPLEQAYIAGQGQAAKLTGITAYWYLASPSLTLEQGSSASTAPSVPSETGPSEPEDVSRPEPPVWADRVTGDVDDDGVINATDALLTLQHSVRLTLLTAQQCVSADVDGSGAVNAADALLILQHSVRLIDAFPVEVLM